MLTICAALATLGSCAAARRYLDRPSRREVEYLGGRVRLRRLWNEGAAFDLPIPREALPLGSAAALGLLWFHRRQSPLGAGLILGGGLSNLWERLRRGRVYDYIQFPKMPFRHYVFNLADLAILTGGILIFAPKRKFTRRNRHYRRHTWEK